MAASNAGFVRVHPAILHQAGAAPIGAVLLKNPDTGEEFFTLATGQVAVLVEALNRAVVEADKAAEEASALSDGEVYLMARAPEGRA